MCFVDGIFCVILLSGIYQAWGGINSSSNACCDFCSPVSSRATEQQNTASNGMAVLMRLYKPSLHKTEITTYL